MYRVGNILSDTLDFIATGLNRKKILSYPILSYPILSYPILSYPILSYPINKFQHVVFFAEQACLFTTVVFIFNYQFYGV